MPDDNSLDITTAITIGVWIRGTRVSGAYVVKDDITHRSFTLGANGATHDIYFQLLGLSPSTALLVDTASLGDDVWHYIVGTYDGASMRAYLDGQEVGPLATTGSITATTVPLRIGARKVGAAIDFQYAGRIDEVRIYNKALTASKIKELFSGSTPVPPGQTATVKVLKELSQGTHTLRLCTASICNTAILTII